MLEFTGLCQDERFCESDLERALIAKLQQFLLELGKGFAFMGRQQRITLDGEHFFIDLVFQNRLPHSFVLLDLKVGKLTHQDLGQMQMYVNYYQRELTAPDENPPIGIVLCTDKNEAVVRYALPEETPRSSRRGTSSIYRPRRSWPPSSSASVGRSSSSSGSAAMIRPTTNDRLG